MPFNPEDDTFQNIIIISSPSSNILLVKEIQH
jgi:hypothetical protein